MEWMSLDQVSEMLVDDPAGSAREAGLRYTLDEEPGIQRKKFGRGFTYFDESGTRITDPERRRRFEELVIPPAWSKVWIAPTPEHHIQATGRDEQNRKQYIYHPRWNEIRRQYHFDRLVPFGYSLQRIRRACEKDLAARKLGQQTLIGAVVKLLDETQARIGNRVYAERHETYGLTTLRRRHMVVCGSTVQLDFVGKSGKQVELNIRNRCLARILKKCYEATGYELFSYCGKDGRRKTISATEVNDYLQEISGVPVTAKDFRPWSGSVQALTILNGLGWEKSENKRRKNIVQTVKSVSDRLNNTPAVCRQHYIHPAIFDSYSSGKLFELVQSDSWMGIPASLDLLQDEEKATLQILQKAIFSKDKVKTYDSVA